MRTIDLDEIKSRNLPRCDWREFLKGETTADDGKALDDYFAKFLPLGPCVGCGKELTGGVLEQVIGTATFTWGLAHGEGYCRECGYPGRALHYDVGPIEKLNIVLQYHPDWLEAARSAAAPPKESNG